MRTTISLNKTVEDLALAVMAKEKETNFSKFCATALTAYCEPRVPAAPEVEVNAAIAVLGKERALRALRREARRAAAVAA